MTMSLGPPTSSDYPSANTSSLEESSVDVSSVNIDAVLASSNQAVIAARPSSTFRGYSEEVVR